MISYKYYQPEDQKHIRILKLSGQLCIYKNHIFRINFIIFIVGPSWATEKNTLFFKEARSWNIERHPCHHSLIKTFQFGKGYCFEIQHVSLEFRRFSCSMTTLCCNIGSSNFPKNPFVTESKVYAYSQHIQKTIVLVVTSEERGH